MSNIKEECGIFAVSTLQEEAAGIVYNGLLSLQHRGQEGTGIAILKGRDIKIKKGTGLVHEVFDMASLSNLKGRLAIGHVRYSTTGGSGKNNAQPFFSEYFFGRIALAHNGNITNAEELKKKLIIRGASFQSSSDTEVVTALITQHILETNSVEKGIVEALRLVKGSFSIVILSSDGSIIAVRDPNGYRPLAIGHNENGIAVASESSALETCGFQFDRDIKPGELIIIRDGKIEKITTPLFSSKKSLCIFEFVYFARTDSIIDEQSVYKARINMGKQLAIESPVEADCVSGVPDSGNEAGLGFAVQIGLPYVNAFVKNRYIGRSFIYPSQAQREGAVRLKMNPLRANVVGKRVVLVDDSIVRGTTMKRTIKAIREAGAKEVHIRISAPPFIHTCYYGTDIDGEDNLIANNMTIDEIRKEIGADSLAFISVEGLKKCCQDCVTDFCTGCFDGNYGEDVSALKLKKNVFEGEE